MDILTGEKFVLNLGCFYGHHLLVSGANWVDGGYRYILASYKFHYIRVHENLVQHPSTNISIVSIEWYSTKLKAI